MLTSFVLCALSQNPPNEPLTLHEGATSAEGYLSHLLNPISEDVRDDDPLLRRGPQVHLDQDDVVEQHQIANVCHLHQSNSRDHLSQKWHFMPSSNCFHRSNCWALSSWSSAFWKLVNRILMSTFLSAAPPHLAWNSDASTRGPVKAKSGF